MAILPASLAPRDTAATSNNSALHVAVIAPAAEEGMTPARASARASPASKSSIPCRQARSERTFSTSSYRNNGSSNSIQQAPYGHGLQPAGFRRPCGADDRFVHLRDPPSFLLHPFQNHRNPLAHPDAHGTQRIPPLRTPQLMRRRHDQPPAARPQLMPERNRSPARVHMRRIL